MNLRTRRSARVCAAAVAALLIVLQTGCASAPSHASSGNSAEAATAAESAGPRRAAVAGGGAQEDAAAPTASARADAKKTKGTTKSESPDGGESGGERKIIKTAYLTVEVTDRRKTVESIESLASRFDGYVLRSSNSSVTIRVDATRLEPAMQEIIGLPTVEKLLQRRLQSRDVTDQMKDYQIRLDNKLEARERYLELMAKAKNVEGMLKIERELERLNGEIERLKGQIKSLKEQVALSKITVHLRGEDDLPDQGTDDPLTPLAPRFEYSGMALGGTSDTTWLHGPSFELSLLSWRDLTMSNGPSHWRAFVGLSLLHPTEGESVPWLSWSGGFQMSFEGTPARKWLIPVFGFEAGQLFAPDRTVGHITPSVGAHLWSAEEFTATLEGSYFIPPVALETLRGWRVDLGVGFTFW